MNGQRRVPWGCVTLFDNYFYINPIRKKFDVVGECTLILMLLTQPIFDPALNNIELDQHTYSP